MALCHLRAPCEIQALQASDAGTALPPRRNAPVVIWRRCLVPTTCFRAPRTRRSRLGWSGSGFRGSSSLFYAYRAIRDIGPMAAGVGKSALATPRSHHLACTQVLARTAQHETPRQAAHPASVDTFSRRAQRDGGAPMKTAHRVAALALYLGAAAAWTPAPAISGRAINR